MSKSLSILLNPGRVSRYYLLGIARAADHIGVRHTVLELAPLWQMCERGEYDKCYMELARRIVEADVGAVFSYCHTAFIGPLTVVDGKPVGCFERFGIPVIMMWTDHPHSHLDQCRAEISSALASPNNIHFVKSQSEVDEISAFFGWQRCHAIDMGEDPEMIKPVKDVSPEHDVVAINGMSMLPPALTPFLSEKHPKDADMLVVVAQEVRSSLASLWERDAEPARRPSLNLFGDAWAEARMTCVRLSSYHHLKNLEPSFQDAVEWLRRHPQSYLKALRAMWEFGRWQRSFYMSYLARHFKVATYGPDPASATPAWVDYPQIGATYAKGRIAININHDPDEEGLSHKPFQIAASASPMLHIDRIGLSECFTPEREVETFNTPEEAAEKIAALLADPDRREAMGRAARQTLESSHTWAHRLRRMLNLAKVQLHETQEPSA